MTDIEVFTLDNGIRCVHRKVRSSDPVAHIALTIGAGTRDEAPGQHGVAHLVEHLMFKGTTRRSAYQVNSLLENGGGELNAFTTKEETVLHASLMKSDFYRGVDLLADMAFGSVFPEKELEKEREVILDEINCYKDSPAELIYDEFEELLFAGSPLGRNILGDKRTLKKANRQQLLDYVRDCYRPDKIVFSASVGISSRRFREICEKYLGGIGRPVRNSDTQAAAPPRQPLFHHVKKKHTFQAHCLVGGYGYDLHHPGRVRLAFLINLLGGPSSISRLNLLLREKYALTYNVEAGYVPYGDSGVYTIYMGCDKDKTERSMELLRKEITRLKEQKLSPAQLARAKKQFIGQVTLASENPEQYMLGLAKSILVFNDYDSAGEINRKIQALTAEELLETANDVFSDENIYSLIYR